MTFTYRTQPEGPPDVQQIQKQMAIVAWQPGPNRYVQVPSQVPPSYLYSAPKFPPMLTATGLYSCWFDVLCQSQCNLASHHQVDSSYPCQSPHNSTIHKAELEDRQLC